jgi:hypothetical protein
MSIGAQKLLLLQFSQSGGGGEVHFTSVAMQVTGQPSLIGLQNCAPWQSALVQFGGVGAEHSIWSAGQCTCGGGHPVSLGAQKS